MSLFDALQREYEHSLIGPVIFQRVRSIVARYLRGRDLEIYANGAYDRRDAIDDVAQSFVLDVLIGERQIDYVFQVALGEEDFDRVVAHHVRRYLARTRRRTVTDNLIDRSVAVLREPPFRTISGSGSSERFGLVERSYPVAGEPTPASVREAVALARAIPTERSDAVERAPRIYGPEALASLLRILLETADGPISRRELQEFFDGLLTPWLPGVLVVDEEVRAQAPDRGYSPEELSIIRVVAQEMIDGMDHQDRLIFVYKHANLPDRLLAARLGLSRQAAAPRKAALFERLRARFRDLEPPIREGVVEEIGARLAAFGIGT